MHINNSQIYVCTYLMHQKYFSLVNFSVKIYFIIGDINVNNGNWKPSSLSRGRINNCGRSILTDNLKL